MNTFDTVKMMRDIRDNLSKKYIEKPEVEDKELEKIRVKYSIKTYRQRDQFNEKPILTEQKEAIWK